jgi:gliding motility-associated protein GldE
MNTSDPSSISQTVQIIEAGFNFSSVLISFIILFVLLVCSALISGAEAAFFSLSPFEKDELKNDTSKAGILVSKLLDIPKQLLATILITNNFLNVAIVIVSSSILSEFFNSSGDVSEAMRFVIEVFVITLVLLIICEVIPKIYATKNALSFSKLMALPLNFFNGMPPFSWLKTGLVNGSNIIHKYAKKKGVKISTDELEHALALTKEENVSEGEHKILEGIVKFGNTDVRQIMKFRMDVDALSDDLNFSKVIELILEYGYSRIPVFSGTFDNVIGILFIKDLLQHLENDESFDWKSLLRKPFFVPENKKIDDLLKEFQSKKVHMAIVVDEYGGASGVVTLEDVLEEIVGDITDEFDEDEVSFTKVDDSTYLFEGRTALIDFYKILEIEGKDFESIKGESDTLGGFVVENAGRILKNNEFFICGDFKLIVASSDKKRIKMVKVVLIPSSDEVDN